VRPLPLLPGGTTLSSPLQRRGFLPSLSPVRQSGTRPGAQAGLEPLPSLRRHAPPTVRPSSLDSL
jgi:hypothetical protein